MIISIAGKQVDLNAVLPLKLRHWKELKRSASRERCSVKMRMWIRSQH